MGNDTQTDPGQIARHVQQSLPADGLFAGHQWRVATRPFPLDKKIIKQLEKLGRILLKFYQATNMIYRWSTEERLPAWPAEWLERGKPEVQVRMGLNTGQMVVGNMGSTMRMDYTIMGDAVNLASRLEGVNKIYGTQLMVSEFTQGDIAEDLETRELDQIRVVGKNEPIKIYEVLAKKGELSAERTKAMAQFAVGLGIYRQKDFEKAEDKFNEVLGILPDDGPSLTYIKRCADYKDNPPPEDWDGVYIATDK